MAVGISNIMLLLFPSHVIPIYFRTKLDEGPFHSEQKAEVHRVWFGGSTENERNLYSSRSFPYRKSAKYFGIMKRHL